MMLRRLLLTIALTGSAGHLHSQTLGPLPRDLTLVQTGGYWSAEHKSGTYRIVILTSGFEIHTSQMFVQWLYNGGSESDTTAVITTIPVRELNELDAGMGNVRLEYSRHRGTVATIDVVDIDTPVDVHDEWMLSLGPPGRYTLTKVGPVANHPRQ